MKASKYVLEHELEAQRLEKQAEQLNYSVGLELSKIKFTSQDKVLDLGCGSGILTRYIAQNYPVASIEGCDFSEFRVKQAKKLSAGLPVQFFADDIYNSKLKSNQYSKIFCRFVLEHLTDPLTACKQIHESLQPEGEAWVIDIDSLIFDLYSENQDLQKMLSTIKQKIKVNLNMGREIPSLLHRAGFRSVEWDLSPMVFKGEELEAEWKNNQERFAIIRPTLIEILGGEREADQFIVLYLDEMMKPHSVLYYTKFIVRGEK